MLELESGLQPVYNIGHVGPNRRAGPFFRTSGCVYTFLFVLFSIFSACFHVALGYRSFSVIVSSVGLSTLLS
jgi:hypothetical protein